MRENPSLSLCSVRGLKYNKTAAAKVNCLCVHRNEISVMFAELFLYLMHGSETRVIRVTHVIKSHASLPLKSLLSFPRRTVPSHPDLQRRPSPALPCGAPCCQPGSPRARLGRRRGRPTWHLRLRPSAPIAGAWEDLSCPARAAGPRGGAGSCQSQDLCRARAISLASFNCPRVTPARSHWISFTERLSTRNAKTHAQARSQAYVVQAFSVSPV